MTFRFKQTALSLVLAGAAATAAAAQGDTVAIIDGDVPSILTYLGGGGAGNTNILFLDSPLAVGPIFNNKAAENPQFTLDTIASETELVFRLNSNGSDNWFTGPASRNSDLFAHAIVTDLGNNTVRVAFEDLAGGGDQNFDDMVFSVSNARVVVSVPEPETYALMLAGLALAAWGGRRRTKASCPA